MKIKIYHKKILGMIAIGLLWCTASFSKIIMQDFIDVLIVIKKPKSVEVAKTLKSVGIND